MRALITGVAGCIGSALAEELVRRGYIVLGLDIKQACPPGLSEYGCFFYRSCDLTNREKTEEVINRFIEANGCFDIVVNNLGLIFSAPVVGLDEGELVCHSLDKWDQVIAITLTSAFHVSTLCTAAMIKSGTAGVIVNISSISASGNPGQSAYSAAKGAINSMTKSQAKELGMYGIRVAAIAPGFIETESTELAIGVDMVKRLRKRIPLRRLGKVEDICLGLGFIIDNKYYTGSILEIDGGLTI